MNMQIRGPILRLALTLGVAAMACAPLPSLAARSGVGPPAAATNKPDPLVAMFVWWNAAYLQKDGFTAEAFGRYFTADTVMRINGKDRCKGLEDLAQHFRDIQAHTDMVVIDLPFIDEFTSASGDRIFTHHFVRARERGEDSRERVMGYATIKDGKIALLNFVSVPDPVAGTVDKKK
jgi:ketosteroid isomerase-like protein